jgi:hypothetical protein
MGDMRLKQTVQQKQASFFSKNDSGRRTKIFAFLVGQSCCSALNSWAAQQRRPTGGITNSVMRATIRQQGETSNARPRAVRKKTAGRERSPA